ncbi:MAG: transcription repressor NadR [Peptostreptococcaceae bacterium]|nr:transcription repressor NadR [Peptostreptococcaceae bacterium]
MSKPERRNQIIDAIKDSTSPVSASILAAQLNVSRQIIVGDIALLRASGHNISATPKGYVFENDENQPAFGYTGIIACKHDEKKLIEELYAIVDLGGTIIDVTIEHSTYGQISGRLDISSRRDVDEFINKLKLSQSKPLSDLTDGIHLHRIGCRDECTFDLIVKDLVEREIALT